MHAVSDITADVFNPISDERSKHPDLDDQAMISPEDVVHDGGSDAPDGPDTSSFTAFLASFMSPSVSTGHSTEEDIPTGAGSHESSGRKSLFARGKRTLGRAIQKVARIGGYGRSSETDDNMFVASDLITDEHELIPMKAPSESAPKSNLPVISEPSLLLSESMKTGLSVTLPVLVQGRNWVLLYSTWRNGISLATLYRRSMLCPGYSLLVVGDRKGAVFGGLVDSPLQPTSQRKYQGTNSNFVFTNLTNPLTIFRPTGTNRYYTLCGSDFLALGGGGHFALYLDGDLTSGSSYHSETFGNSCLAHSQDFDVKEVELWGFVLVSKYDEMLALCRAEKPGVCRW